MENLDFLKGRIIDRIEGDKGGHELKLFMRDGKVVTFYHMQDCCEYVRIEDIVGDLSDLVGEPLLLAEESNDNATNVGEYGTWTFYKFGTRKGYVDIRWLGESNGYYSERVDWREE